MASLLTPTVGPGSGITNRVNSFEQNLGYVDRVQRTTESGLNELNTLAKGVISMRLAAHNAANDARITDYSLRLQQEHLNVLNDLKSKTNKDAIDARESVLKSFDEIQERLGSELKDQDPYVINSFNAKAKELAFRAQSEADAYIVEQSVKYRDSQRAAQLDNLYEQMAMNFDNPVLFSKAREEFEAARAQQDDELGIEPGSEMSIQKTMKYTDELYSNEAIRLIGQKRFGEADKMLKGAAQNGLIKADSYNKHLANLLAQQESAARQAEMDAQRRANFAMAQQRHAEQMQTEQLKQEKLKREAQDDFYKRMYSPLPEYERNAMLASRVQSLKDNDVFKYSNKVVVDEATGLETVMTVENAPEVQEQLITMQAMEDQRNYEQTRTVGGIVERNAFNALAQAAAQGNGDTVLERADDYLLSLPDGPEKEVLANSISFVRNGGYKEDEIEGRMKMQYDLSKPTSTALAKNVVSDMNLNEIPQTQDGKVDLIALRAKIGQKGISNYDVLAINKEAQKKIDAQKKVDTSLFESKPYLNVRKSTMTTVAYKMLDDDLLSDEVFSFDLDDGSSSDPEDREKYAAGQHVIQKVIEELEQRVNNAGLATAEERQRYFISLVNNASTKELFLKYARDYTYDVGKMSVDELNAYDDERIENWKKGQ